MQKLKKNRKAFTFCYPISINSVSETLQITKTYFMLKSVFKHSCEHTIMLLALNNISFLPFLDIISNLTNLPRVHRIHINMITYMPSIAQTSNICQPIINCFPGYLKDISTIYISAHLKFNFSIIQPDVVSGRKYPKGNNDKAPFVCLMDCCDNSSDAKDNNGYLLPVEW